MMDEVVINIPVDVEKIMAEVGYTRKKSIGNSSIRISRAEVSPHYLKPSTGSCHEFCKYGINHVSGTKPHTPVPKRFISTPEKRKNPAKAMTSVQRRKSSVICPKSSPEFKSQTPNKTEVIKKVVLASTKKEGSSLKKHQTLQSKTSSLLHSSRRFSDIITPKGIIGGLHTNPVGVSSSKRNGEIKLSKVVGTSKMSKKSDMVPQTGSSSPNPYMRRGLSTKPTNSKNPKKVSPMKIESSARKVETEEPTYDNVPVKTLYVIEPHTETKTPGHTENGSRSSLSLSGEKSLGYEQNGAQAPLSLPSSEKKKFDANQFSSSPSQPSNIKDSRHTRISTSMQRSGSILDRKGEKNQIVNPKVDNKIRTRKSEKIIAEDRDCSPKQLKFRKGKVVDIQNVNMNARKLRFRQGKILSQNENAKNDTKGRSLRRVAVDGQSNNTKSESMKVVLRHQTLEGKKGTMSLFNNVIEETASKLVQTRKSKVKALVGAFETVISLQDTKPKAAISKS